MLDFLPKLLNSATPWATTKEQLQRLYECPFTGAVTIRTSLLEGFDHDDSIHQYAFLTDNDGTLRTPGHSSMAPGKVSSLNTFGYSPESLTTYLGIVCDIYKNDTSRDAERKKPFIFSVSGTPEEVVDCYHKIVLSRHPYVGRMLMEINLSCPNISGKPPPAYSKVELAKYLDALNTLDCVHGGIEVGIKTPPYTHQQQFEDLISALAESTMRSGQRPIDYITATNTLGNCLLLDPKDNCVPLIRSYNGVGIGGLAGAALHPLALGNVRTLRRMLDAHEELANIGIIGVGGVADGAGFNRMLRVGAEAVAVGTAYGCEGIGIFEKIEDDSQIPNAIENNNSAY